MQIQLTAEAFFNILGCTIADHEDRIVPRWHSSSGPNESSLDCVVILWPKQLQLCQPPSLKASAMSAEIMPILKQFANSSLRVILAAL